MTTAPEESVRALAQELLENGIAHLNERERRVLVRLARRRAQDQSLSTMLGENLSFGQRAADAVARLGGSWGFVLGFLFFLLLWCLANLLLPAPERFDPYPFIFLNLVLSMLAAVQAPIIMMSQNRQALRDRAQATLDYEVNLKAEAEIGALDAKLDRLLAAVGEAQARPPAA